MASNNESNGKITIANIIAVFGIVMLSALFFLGFLYTGDTLGISILKGVGLGCVFALLLWFMIKAKPKTNLEDKGKWMMSEYIALALYIGLAVVSCNWMTQFVNVYAAKNDIKESINKDLETIETVINDFKNNERTKMSELSTDLNTALNEARMDRSVEDLLCKLLDVRNLDDVGGSSIDNNIYQPYSDSIADISEANGWDTELSTCEKEISKWNILRLPKLIERVNNLGSDVTEKLNDFAERIPHYAVHDNPSEHVYHAEEQSADTYEVEMDTPSMMKNLKTSPWGYGACALIHFLILFNYLMTRRSNKIRNRKSNETAIQSGHMLNIDNN